MSLFGTRTPPPSDDASEQNGRSPEHEPVEGLASIPGERGVPSIHRARSLQSRVSSVLAIALMSALGLGLLTWYYARAFTHTARVREHGESLTRTRAQAELPLPALGHIDPPMLVAARSKLARPIAEGLLGPPPPLPSESVPGGMPPAALTYGVPASGTPPAVGTAPKTPGELALERRLAGLVFARESGTAPPGSADLSRSASSATETATPGETPTDSTRDTSARDGPQSELATLLRPSVTPAVRARVLPTRDLLLSKGAFIDCTLETAIDSSLPGMTTCITATDTFGADGQVVLLERGTKLVGETRGQVQQGGARLFVLWTEARTPTGVVVPLASEGSDELGRAGLAGEVNRHFWDRFGAAILISVINGAVQAGAQSASGNGGTVILNPTGSQDVMTEVLKSTVAIAPTVTKHQGDRIEILVARDLDFRSVYELRTSAAAVSPKETPR